MNEAATIAARFEEAFERIRVERMAGVPILNTALSVAMTELQVWEGFHAGVLVTPWFINVLLVARDDEAGRVVTGTKKLFHLPAGAFEFIRSEEDGLGGFWMCSLFSPALEFGDQETAMAVAQASFAELMAQGEDVDDADMARIWRGELPRDDVADNAADGLAEAGSERDDRESGKASRNVNRRAFLTAGHDRTNSARGDAT
ncbi:MAG: [NiFe]-hydrogenase assembly chaperone HybE [Novosphingobium sp.]|nr:[NiFe]-hydrogenase assembly chaperone HybE [Novosphingobium sp.]